MSVDRDGMMGGREASAACHGDFTMNSFSIATLGARTFPAVAALTDPAAINAVNPLAGWEIA